METKLNACKGQFIEGSVCAARGFTAAGVHCGIRRNRTKKDLALIVSQVPASAAATYTTNLVKGAPLDVTRTHLQNGIARAIICNSGNANTCNVNGIEIAEKTCALTGQALGCDADDIVVASTGVIGEVLDITPIAAGIPELVAALSCENTDNGGSNAAAEAIMTTDTHDKQVAVAFQLGDVTCHIGGISKGSGMIHPNMATMLAFITSDAAIAPDMLQQALSAVVADSFNMISVDGDTSTNDMCVVLANGLAGNTPIEAAGADFDAFTAALSVVCTTLARQMAADGEGATKLLTCEVVNAPSRDVARTVAKSVICSSLTKAAMFGEDANWGRVLCAIGYSGAQVDVHKIDVSFRSVEGSVDLCVNGGGIPFSEEVASKVLSAKEIVIAVNLNDGTGSATAWGCDLTYDYVHINGDYRS